MSSTWFKNIRAFKSKITTPYARDLYVMLAETAESNVIANDGSHVYQESFFLSGDYYEIMKEVCKMSYHFEGGELKWKPSNKTPEGFIRTNRKVLETAMETEELPYPVKFAYCCDNRELTQIFEVLASYPAVKLVCNYLGTQLESSNIITIYKIRAFLNELEANYGRKATLLEAKEYAYQIAWNNPTISKLFV